MKPIDLLRRFLILYWGRWVCVLSLVTWADSVHSAESFKLHSEQITFGPENHFFGYIGHVQNIPWNGDGRYILAMRTSFQDHLPDASEPADIVLIDTHSQYEVATD